MAKLRDQWPLLMVTALALALCADAFGQTIYGNPAPVFSQNQVTGDATAQQNITIPLAFTAALNGTTTFGASGSATFNGPATFNGTFTSGAGTIALTSLATIPNNRLLGNSSGGAASPSAQTPGAEFTQSAGAFDIATNGVTNTMLAQMATKTFKCNSTGGTANAADCTVSTVNTTTGLYNGATLSAFPGAPAGTTSTSSPGVMMGLGSTCKITPAISTRVSVTLNGQMTNSTAADSANVGLRFGTGSAPTNGTAATGTIVVTPVTASSFPAASSAVPFSLTGVITGLTPATQIWIDANVFATTGGTASIAGLTCSSFEM